MGTILASVIINKAKTVLQDAAGVRWPDAELLGYLNEGQRAILTYKSNAYVRTRSVQLIPGTLQSLPSDGVQLFDIVRNMGTNGATPGRAIRLTKREMLDSRAPNWHLATASAETRHYMYAEASPRQFLVYPPQPSIGPGWVEMIYGAIPPDVALSAPIAVDDIYEMPLLDFVLYRAWMKDSEFGADGTRSASHMQAFVTAITGKARNEAGASPNVIAPANTATPVK
jgi:hypothetical protein